MQASKLTGARSASHEARDLKRIGPFFQRISRPSDELRAVDLSSSGLPTWDKSAYYIRLMNDASLISAVAIFAYGDTPPADSM